MKSFLEPAIPFAVKELVAYAPGATVSKIITKNANGNTTLFAFDQGQELSEHTAPFDAIVLMVEGEARITIGGSPQDVVAGQMIIMPANIPHALSAIAPFKMLLIMIKDEKRA